MNTTTSYQFTNWKTVECSKLTKVAIKAAVSKARELYREDVVLRFQGRDICVYYTDYMGGQEYRIREYAKGEGPWSRSMKEAKRSLAPEAVDFILEVLRTEVTS